MVIVYNHQPIRLSWGVSNRLVADARVSRVVAIERHYPDPFVKDVEYAGNEEFRLVFDAVNAVQEHVIFRLDAIKEAFSDGLLEVV